jgi:hypothetical protein
MIADRAVPGVTFEHLNLAESLTGRSRALQPEQGSC